MKTKIHKNDTKWRDVAIIDRTCIHRYDKPIPTFTNSVRQLNKSL